MPTQDSKQAEYIVQVVEVATSKVVYSSSPTYLRRAEKIEDGLGINLDWGRFSTRLVEAGREAGTGASDG